MSMCKVLTTASWCWIDEAQLLYNCIGIKQIFASLEILQQHPTRYNMRVLIAAAYGTGEGYKGGANLTETSIELR